MFNQAYLLTAIILSLKLTSCSFSSDNSLVAKTTVVKGDELNTIRALFNNLENSCKPSIKIIKSADTSKYDFTSSVDTNVNILEVIMPQENGMLRTNLSLSNCVGSYRYAGYITDTVLCEQSQDYWFLAWLDEPFYKNKIGGNINKHHRYELHVRAIEKSTCREVLDSIIYTTACCLNELDIQYNKYTRSLLYAFNDFGDKDITIFYGSIRIDDSKNLKVQTPLRVVFKDDTDKRQPIFFDNGSSLFLYHTTGDSWEFTGHIGKQQMGVFKIDSANRLVEHKIISDEYEVDEKILMIKDSLYYRLKDTNAFKEMTIKRIAWNDLVEYELK
jgi:hypothetical protein